MKHSTDATLRVTIPQHNVDIPPGTLNSIIKQSGLTREAFVGLL